MIHYSCDGCKREIRPEESVRYEMKVEINLALDPSSDVELDDERDHLEEISEILENEVEGSRDLHDDPIAQAMRFDLCPACARRFVRHPLGREVQFDFSPN